MIYDICVRKTQQQHLNDSNLTAKTTNKNKTDLESNLSNTFWAADVETENPQSQKVFIIHILFAWVELLPFVDVLPTNIAPVQ